MQETSCFTDAVAGCAFILCLREWQGNCFVARDFVLVAASRESVANQETKRAALF